ncbi:hypothetical protein TNCV_2207171 [Trichonephila clavipes]|uniref:Uncharacterized protein n=1 Tax=Trichonephila clavipes TaxID=2585209 RepID=A0A8X6SB63_TRICX|nr:hypothetical protein TNCV_2207171 [Trichonephila clavipes]
MSNEIPLRLDEILIWRACPPGKDVESCQTVKSSSCDMRTDGLLSLAPNHDAQCRTGLTFGEMVYVAFSGPPTVVLSIDALQRSRYNDHAGSIGYTPSTNEYPLCSWVVHIKSVDAQTSPRWCGAEVRSQLKCRHLIVFQNYEACLQ